jgi:RNA polymerase sigma-70 factor, ECF subfamily
MKEERPGTEAPAGAQPPQDLESRLAGLMAASQAGDGAAYRQLLEELRALASRYIIQRLNRRENMEDVVQEILISTHRARATHEPGRPFLPWFYAIVKYRMIDWLRHSGRVLRNETLVEELPDVAAPAGEDDGQLSEEMLACLQKLSPAQRTIVEMLKVQGLSVRETAGKLGMSESAVKVAAHRAYAKLRAALEGGRLGRG